MQFATASVQFCNFTRLCNQAASRRLPLSRCATKLGDGGARVNEIRMRRKRRGVFHRFPLFSAPFRNGRTIWGQIATVRFPLS